MHNKRIIIDAKLVVARMLVTAPSFFTEYTFQAARAHKYKRTKQAKNILCAVHRLQLTTTSECV